MLRGCKQGEFRGEAKYVHAGLCSLCQMRGLNVVLWEFGCKCKHLTLGGRVKWSEGPV